MGVFLLCVLMMARTGCGRLAFYGGLPLLRFTRELLELELKARAKALAKTRKLEQSLLAPMDDTS